MKKKYIISILISLIIFFLISIFILIFLSHIQNLIDTNNLKNLAEIIKQDVEKIENKIQEHMRILGTILNEIEEQKPTNEQEIFNIYNRNLGKEEFSRIAILYEGGKTSTSDGEIVDLSEDINYFFESDKMQISKRRYSKVNNSEVNIYSKRTIFNGKSVVILLVIETEKYEEMFTQKIYNGTGMEYIITNEGDIVANSEVKDKKINIFEEMKQINDKEIEKVEKMKEILSNNTVGQMIYSMKEHNYYIAFEKLNIENWILVVITPASMIAEELNNLLKIILIVLTIISVIIFIIILYILISNVKKKEDLYKLAYIDKITGLGNYNYYKKKIKENLEKDIKKTIIILDINNFKAFNKKYGYIVGNKMLKALGKGIKENIRKEDVVCRIANDNFGIFILGEIDIETFAKRLNGKLSKIYINDICYNIRLTIGIYVGDEKKVDELIDKAIIAHDKVKGIYNKEYCLFNDKLEEELFEANEIENSMEEAIEKEEFEILYQPKVSVEKEVVEGAEALVRWNKNGEYISPRKIHTNFREK